MGMPIHALRFLLSTQHLGAGGRNICNIGRQTLYGKEREINAMLAELGRPAIKLAPSRAMYFSEDVLSQLGYQVDNLDASAYEGANIIQDLNQPISPDLQDRYDLVFDGGSLEHVFNFPVALDNCMKMLRVGGHLLLFTPANNQCGHGFYQFSPELFFRALTERNGFEIVRLYITGGDRAFHVVDPIEVHGRVQLLNDDGAMLLVHAKKIASKPLSAPQQSDYVENWSQAENTEQTDSRLKGFLRKRLPETATTKISSVLNKMRHRRAVRSWRRDSTLSNRRFYQPVTDWTVPSASAFKQ